MAQRLVREAEDPRSRDPVPDAAGPPAPRPPRRGARRRLPRLQRGLRLDGVRRPRSARTVRRGDPAREAPRGADAGRAGGARAARVAPPPRRAARRTGRRARRPRPARGTGSHALGPCPDRRGRAGARAGRCASAGPGRTSSRPGSRRSASGLATAAPDWGEIAALYAGLAAFAPSPVIELNRAVAVAMARGPEAGLTLVDRIGGLKGYHLLHATRADLLRRLGRLDEAESAYRRAHELATSPVERRYLKRRLAETRQ